MIPMLSAALGPKFDRFPCYVQPKLNGIRALYQDGTFQSRDEKVWHPDKLGHIVSQLNLIQGHIGNVILDGELYVHGWRLGRINGAVSVNSSAITADTLEIVYNIFDVINPFNEEVHFSSRWFDIYHPLNEAELPNVRAVPTALVADRTDLDRHFLHYVSAGYEGLMARPDGPYELGRTPHGTRKNSKFLWKHKAWEDNEFLCCTTTPGEGKADIGIGSLTLLTSNGVTFNCGTGFTDEERIALSENPPVGKYVRVRYPYLSEDGIPQCPSFLGVMD